MDLIEKAKEKAKGYVQEKIDNIPKPEATMEGLSLKGVGWDGVSYNVNVGIMNPYPHSIPLCDVAYTLMSDGRVILSGNMPDPGDLEGKHAITKLDVGIKVPHSAAISLVRDICADWDIDYELQLVLIIDVPIIGNFDIHLSQTGEIKLPTISSFWSGDDTTEKKTKDMDQDKSSETDQDDDEDKKKNKDQSEEGGGFRITSILCRSESYEEKEKDIDKDKDNDKDSDEDGDKKKKKKTKEDEDEDED